MLRFGEGDYGDSEVGKVGDQRRVRSDVGQQHGSKGRKRGSGVLENNKHSTEQLLRLCTHDSIRNEPDEEFFTDDVSGHSKIIRKVD